MRSQDRIEVPGGGIAGVVGADGNFVVRADVFDCVPLLYCEFVGYRTYWQSGTSGHPGAYLRMQTDGNLVLRGSNGRVLWQSRTAGHPGAHLEMQLDDNLVLRSATGTALWQSGTAGVEAPVVK